MLAVTALLAVDANSACAQGTRIPVNDARLAILKEVQLSAEIPGILDYVNPTEEGQVVKKGDIIIRLKDDVVQAQLREAEKKAESEVEIKFAQTALAKAEIDLQVQKEKNAQASRQFTVFTESEIRQSELEVQKAQAQLEKSNEDKIILQLAADVKRSEIGQYTVLAPEDAVVTQVHKWPGQAVRQGDPVLTVTDLTILRAVLLVDYSYRDQISVGNTVELTISSRRKPAAGESGEAAVEPARTRSNPLEGAPGLRPSAPAFDAPAAPATAPSPFDNPPAAASARQGEKFVGTVTFVTAKLSTRGELTVFVNVPNRQDRQGRYLLQEGVPVEAWIQGK